MVTIIAAAVSASVGMVLIVLVTVLATKWCCRNKRAKDTAG